MSHVDAQGYAVSGADPGALDTFERALAAFRSWRKDADIEVAVALQEAPGFVMAHVLQAYMNLCSRDPRRARAALPALARAARLPANERERLHVAAISAAVGGDYKRANDALTELLRSFPRDLLALQVAHAFDYLTGDVRRMRDRPAAVLPAWTRDMPGYHAVLAMHAFGLEECGEYERAEDTAREALALNAADARAHHVMAHVFEMTDRPDAGVRWMNEHVNVWSIGTVVATHCWWHLALFRLAQGQLDRALALYDRRVRERHSDNVAELVDGAALLWRLQLLGADTGARAVELADAWANHIDDAFCSFNDVHAMLAFVAAQDWNRAQRLELALQRGQATPTRHGETTRLLGLPACRALIAFGRGDDALAIELLASLPARAHRLGGSHAQRDVLNLTLLHAIERIRRPVRRRAVARAPIAAAA
jgi:tetratricopeptide (TPR) repeat protein